MNHMHVLLDTAIFQPILDLPEAKHLSGLFSLPETSIVLRRTERRVAISNLHHKGTTISLLVQP